MLMLALVPITLQDRSYFISILSIGFLNFELNIILTTTCLFTKQQTPAIVFSGHKDLTKPPLICITNQIKVDRSITLLYFSSYGSKFTGSQSIYLSIYLIIQR